VHNESTSAKKKSLPPLTRQENYGYHDKEGTGGKKSENISFSAKKKKYFFQRENK